MVIPWLWSEESYMSGGIGEPWTWLEADDIEEVAEKKEAPVVAVGAILTGCIDEDPDAKKILIVWNKRQFWRPKKGRGPRFDGHSGWKLIEGFRRSFPGIKLGREYETFLCFERWIVYNSVLRDHEMCRYCWILEGDPIIVDGVDVRLRLEDVPDWVGDSRNGGAAKREFYDCMDFWWRTMLDSRLPLRIVDVVRSDGSWGGVQVVARRVCTFEEAQECLVGFLEEVGDDEFTELERLNHRSFVHIPFKTVQDHKAILFGMAAYVEHQCQADTRLSHAVGVRVFLRYLQADPPAERVGYVPSADG